MMKSVLRFIKNGIVIFVIMALAAALTFGGIYYKLSDPNGNNELAGIVKKPVINSGSFNLGIVSDTYVDEGTKIVRNQKLALIDTQNGEFAEIKSTIDGSVEKIIVEEGGFVAPGNVIFELSNDSKGYIEVTTSINKQKVIDNFGRHVIFLSDDTLLPVTLSEVKPIEGNQKDALYVFDLDRKNDILLLKQGQSVVITPLKIVNSRLTVRRIVQSILRNSEAALTRNTNNLLGLLR